MLHGTWNSVIPGPFDGATSGAARLLWTGESGILVVLMLLLATLIVVWRPALVLRQPQPKDAPRTTASS